jgi:hypothetical protein
MIYIYITILTFQGIEAWSIGMSRLPATAGTEARCSSEKLSSRYIVSRGSFVAKANVSRETNAISTLKR